MSNFTTKPTMYVRDLHPSDPNYAWIACKTESDLWTLYCKYGPTYVWNTKEKRWVSIMNMQPSNNYEMSFKQACQLLETIDTIQALI